MLSADTIAIIKATIPALQAGGEALTRHFYQRMFTHDPAVRAFFNPAHQYSGGQQRALAAAILAYATHIENPAALASAVELIAQKHAALGVKAEHYPIVGKHLLASIKEVLGEAATDAVIDAWAQAYGVLAEIFIQRERQIYDDHREQHGWEGTKPFIVRNKRRESATVTSLYLVPADGSPIRPFKPGQYITVRVPGTDGVPTTMRNYSLSGRPGQPYYRISVKREPAVVAGAPAGHVSNHLHDGVNVGDTLEVGPPCGEFVLERPSAPRRPLVLIGGGVGVTPVLSMLHAALECPEHAGRDVWFIQASLDGDVHAFADEVRALADANPRLRTHVRLSRPTAGDRERRRHDSEGFVDAAFLASLLGERGPGADFYFCGPSPMMAGLYHGLLDWGVPAAQVRYEFFGPAQALRRPERVAAPAPDPEAEVMVVA